MNHAFTRRSLLGRSALGLGLATTGGLALSACSTPGGGGAGGTALTMFHWAGAQGEVPVQVGDAWAAEHGIDITYIEGTNADTFPKLVSSVQVNPDQPLLNLGFFNAQSFATGDSQDLWLEIPDSVSNVAQVLPDYQIDNGRGAYMVMDAMGLIYNTEVFPEPPTSWMDLFDAAHRGKVTTWDAPAFGVNALPVIAQLNGGSESDLGPGLEIFADAAKSGQFNGFISSLDQLRQQLIAGEVIIAPGFQGVAEPWIQAGDPIGFAIPEEGVMAFPEGFQIVKGSTDAQVEAAAGLMNEIFDPANVSAYCEATGTIPLVEGATLGEAYADRPGFQLETVEAAIQLDWAALVASTEEATATWNSQVKANI